MFASTLARRSVNGLWVAACGRGHRQFVDALDRVEQTQSRYLLALLRRNAHTRFGATHDFARIRSMAEYQQRVPITPYEALAPAVEAIARGEEGVLTADPVQRFQPTSGSTSGTKLIPWTRTVAAEFQRAIAPWITSLYRRQPALLGGTAYWSISPPVSRPPQGGRIPVGFDDDAAYLGPLARRLFSLVSAVPADVAQARRLEEFRTRTLLALLADEELRLISVWSPTFLSVLLEDLLGRRAELADRLARSDRAHGRRRAALLRSMRDTRPAELFSRLWPKLAVLSCWTHASSERAAGILRGYFPEVEMQPKGLIATEAFVSLPLHDDCDPVLAVTSHFFEFQEAESGRIALAHEVEIGREYDVIVTTGGGLYRYPLGDRVRVTGCVQGAPCLRFLGRGNLVSDLAGEKLHGLFVEEVVRRVLREHAIDARFALLAPATAEPGSPGYVLFLEPEGPGPHPRLAEDLERGLAANFHYQHCRELGQLRAARVFVVDGEPGTAEAVYLRHKVAEGTKAGDVKLAPLDRNVGWESRFPGRFVG